MTYTRCAAVIALLILANAARASSHSEDELINYAKSATDDPIARLEKKIANGEISFEHEKGRGYLKSLLKALDVPASSQMLVFSKTSFQRNLISPSTPRALYFADDIYIGFVQGGEVMEISSVDPKLGPIFYTVSQKPDGKPRFQRQTDNCLQCHESSMTEYVPGHLVRSVFPDDEGQPILSAGTFRISYESPLKDRWGGWYVSGNHGMHHHMGNGVVKDREKVEIDFHKGSNVTDLSTFFDVSPYLTQHSDIAALMVFEYQTRVHNLITRCNYLTRLSLRDEQVLNKALNRGDDYRSESTVSRIKNACEPLVKALLLGDEAPLVARIEGTSGFAKEFSERGPRDSKGRSLRELDLRNRLFKYPCGYLIYSEAFDSLPTEAKEFIYQRLWDVLTKKELNDGFPRLADDDRKAIKEILIETKKDLPEYWKK